jgi:hypothetical protein
MRFFLLSALFLTRLALADNPATLECSDATGTLTYTVTQYDGGALPSEPSFELSRETWKRNGQLLREVITTVGGQKTTGLMHVSWGRHVPVDEAHVGDLPVGVRVYAIALTWDDGTLLQPAETHLLCRQYVTNLGKP